MGLQVEKLGNNMARLTIEVPAGELEKAIERAYQKNKNKVSLPGFRKGRAPRRMLEQVYGKSLFYEDAANLLIPEAYGKACDECGEEIVSAPKVDIVQIESGRPFLFTAEVALKPEVTLGQYKGVKVGKFDVVVTEEEVTAEIDRERDKNARTVEVTDRPVREGDIATLDFEGFLDGEAFEGGKGENHPLTIGSHAFIPGFEEALVGAELNEETEVHVTFPEDYQVAELAGCPAVFKCTVKRLQEKQLPELDEDFVSEVSEVSDTVEEYQEEIRKKLADRKAEEARAAKENAVVAAVIADARMEIPEPMVETRQKQMVQDYAQRIQSQGISLEQYMQITGMTMEKFLEQMKPQAMWQIQSRLVLEAVVAAEQITVSEEEIAAELKKMGEFYQIEMEEVEKRLGRDGRTQVMEDIRVRKAVDFVVERAVEA